MAILTIQKSPTGLKLRPAKVIRSTNDLSAWQNLLRELLAFVVDGRPCFAITEEPRGWSIGHELGSGRDWTINGKPYLSVFMPSTVSLFLDEIAESEDFERGFLWFLFKDKDQETNLADILESVRAARHHGQPLETTEILRLAGDGQVLDWQTPSREDALIDAKIYRLAGNAGWQVEMVEG